tara:strand:+ start:12506 stop:13294 length:789 start_codon:yes stop_codon:yes gene_type:complete
MKLKVTLIFIVQLFVIPFNSFSEDGYSRVIKNCFDNKDWGEQLCRLYELPDDPMYMETPDGNFAMNTTPILFEFIDEVFDVLETPLYIPYVLTNREDLILDKAESRKQAYKDLVVKYSIENRSLKNCQKACLVKCITANILKGQRNWRTKLGAVESSFLHEKGECTEYSRIATFLGSSIGLKTGIVAGKSHAFVEYTINGQRYFAEPQDSSCSFFQTRKRHIPMLQAMEENLNQKNRFLQSMDSPSLDQGWDSAPPISSKPR